MSEWKSNLDKDFYCEQCGGELEDGLCTSSHGEKVCEFNFKFPNKTSLCGLPGAHGIHSDKDQQYYHDFYLEAQMTKGVEDGMGDDERTVKEAYPHAVEFAGIIYSHGRDEELKEGEFIQILGRNWADARSKLPAAVPEAKPEPSATEGVSMPTSEAPDTNCDCGISPIPLGGYAPSCKANPPTPAPEGQRADPETYPDLPVGKMPLEIGLENSIPQRDAIRELVDRQAEDEGLWFKARTLPEAYLQQELRKLHAAIEAKVVDSKEGQDDER